MMYVVCNTTAAHSGRMDSGYGPYHSPGRQQYNGSPGGQRRNESPGRQRYNDPRYESPPPNMRRASLALMHGADVQERHEKYLQQKNYQQYLLEQIEEKNRRKAQEKAEREVLLHPCRKGVVECLIRPHAVFVPDGVTFGSDWTTKISASLKRRWRENE